MAKRSKPSASARRRTCGADLFGDRKPFVGGASASTRGLQPLQVFVGVVAATPDVTQDRQPRVGTPAHGAAVACLDVSRGPETRAASAGSLRQPRFRS